MLKVNHFYMFCYPNKERQCVQVIQNFPNNFVEVWWLRGGYVSGLTRRNHFNEALCNKKFINLDTVSEIEEITIPE